MSIMNRQSISALFKDQLDELGAEYTSTWSPISLITISTIGKMVNGTWKYTSWETQQDPDEQVKKFKEALERFKKLLAKKGA